MIFTKALCASLMMITVSVQAQVSSLTRWSSDKPLVGEIVELTRQGVSLKLNEEIIPTLIPWYDVRSLQPNIAGYSSYQQRALDAWRAHSRLDRGDLVGAEAIYRKLEAEYMWTSGAQGADVSMGLLLCRLDRKDRVHAIIPFISWLGSSQANRSSDGVSATSGQDGFDPQYQLFKSLPPVFSMEDHRQVIGKVADAIPESGRQRVLFKYYQLALNKEIHHASDAELAFDNLRALTRESGKKDMGLILVEEIVLAQAHPEKKKRASARKALARRIRAHEGTWVEAWARLAIGVSMMNEPETDINEKGVIELIHIVVRLGHVNQPVAELASQIANEYFVRTNRKQWGSELILEAKGGWQMNAQPIKEEHTAHD